MDRDSRGQHNTGFQRLRAARIDRREIHSRRQRARLLIVEVASDDDEVDVLVECDLNDDSTEGFVRRSLQALSQ